MRVFIDFVLCYVYVGYMYYDGYVLRWLLVICMY